MKTCLLASLILTGLCAAETTPRFQVTTRKSDDKVEVQADGGKIIFSVRSPSGIGSATIERTEQKWPETVVLKLHLNGLEGFVVSNGKTKINAAVSSQNGK